MIEIKDLIKLYIMRDFIGLLIIVVLGSTPFIFVGLSILIEKIKKIKKL